MGLQKGIPVDGKNPDELIETVDTCVICGTKLVYYHLTDFKNQSVEEEGQCPSCGVKNKINKFTLQ